MFGRTNSRPSGDTKDYNANAEYVSLFDKTLGTSGTINDLVGNNYNRFKLKMTQGSVSETFYIHAEDTSISFNSNTISITFTTGTATKNRMTITAATAPSIGNTISIYVYGYKVTYTAVEYPREEIVS